MPLGYYSESERARLSVAEPRKEGGSRVDDAQLSPYGPREQVSRTAKAGWRGRNTTYVRNVVAALGIVPHDVPNYGGRLIRIGKGSVERVVEGGPLTRRRSFQVDSRYAM